MTNTLNSLLFTSMNVPPKMHPNRGERNTVLINNHLPISNEGHFISFTLVVSPSSNTLMSNSFTLFISLVLMIYDTKKAYRYAETTHNYRLLLCIMKQFNDFCLPDTPHEEHDLHAKSVLPLPKSEVRH